MMPHDHIPPGFASSGAAARFRCLCSRHSSSIWHFSAALFVAAIALMSVARAQTPGISGVNVVFQHLSTERGLSNKSVWAITQDKHGFIWIGTSDGLNRFDGRRCLVYRAGPDSSGLSDSWIWSLFSDRDSTLWVGTNHGLNRFDPRTLTFKKYLHDSGNSASLGHNEVHAIYRDRAGTLWVGTKYGLDRFEPRTETWTHFLPNPVDSTRPGDNFLTAILEDNEGTLWIETGVFSMRGGGIFSFNREQGTFARIDTALGKDYSDGFIAPRSDDIPGNLWVCSSDRYGPEPFDQWSGVIRSLSVERPRRTQIEPQNTRNPAATYGLFRVSEDRHGAVWGRGTRWGKLFRYEIRKGQSTMYAGDVDAPDSLSSGSINVVFTDRSGLLWIGTDDEGVFSASTKPFLFRHTVGDSPRIVSANCLTFADRNGNLWLGSLRFDVTTQIARYVLGNAGVTDLCQDDEGTIWACDSYGLAKYVPRLDKLQRVWWLPYAGLDEVATCLFIDSKNLFWVGTQGGIYRLNRDFSNYKRFDLDSEKVGGIVSGRVTSIYEDKLGTVWVGTMTGLYQFQYEGDSLRVLVHEDRDSVSLSSNFCTGALEDIQGRLWVSSAGGLDRFDPTHQAFSRHLHRPVGRIVADRKGRFWFGSAGKLFGPSGEMSMFDPTSGLFKTFGVSDGLPNQDVYGWPHAMLKSGELVFGTNKGIVVFHPDSVKHLEFIPPVVITEIRLFEKAVPLRTASDLARELSFEHDQNVLSIAYAALSYDAPERNQYAYRLEGFDKDWIYCGNRQEATYTNLDPGSYTFHVKGSNHDGVWNEAGAVFAIVIQPAYWQTWWFRGLLIIAMVGLGGSAVGYGDRLRARRKIERLEREHALERERARISQDMHDEIGSSLSEIAILSELARKKPGEAETRMKEISERSAEVIESVSEIVWAMNPQNDTIENFIGYIRRYAVKYLGLAGIACEFNAPETIPPIPLAAEIRRNLFLVVKEALHNIVKHSGASVVVIVLVLNEQRIEGSIRDNGRGLDLDGHDGTGNGLVNMRKRMTAVGGEFTIESTPGAGTQVTVAVPLK
jgi:signal transduction histidine kinase/ligand-binding sensor domain-containing protein